MSSARSLPFGALGLLAGLLAALLWASPAAAGFPPAGSDDFTVSGSVSITSRLGQETIALSGTATINRGSPYMQGGVEVVDTEIVSMSLTGMSLTGPVTVIESPSRASTGELRSLYAESGLPASSFFDVFVEATIPASGPGGSTATEYNSTALYMTLGSGDLYYWPPASATYNGTPNAPGVPLFPSDPKGIYVTSASVTISIPPAPVGGVAELSGVEPAAATTTRAGDAWGPSANAIAIFVGATAITVLAGAVFAYRRARR